MNKSEYLDALEKLGLTPASKTTARHLGLSVRQIQKYVEKHPQDIPEPIAKLIRAYVRHPRLMGKI